MADLTLQHIHGDQLPQVRQTLLDVYAEVYGDLGKLNDPFFSVERFDERLTGHSSGPGWEAVIGYDQDQPIGYAYLASLTGGRWWSTMLNPLPAGYADEDGTRTAALFELMVRGPWRKTGAAEQIHEELLSGRSEERVTLLVDPKSTKVKALYERWGYEHVGDQQPFPDSPIYAVMVRRLR